MNGVVTRDIGGGPIDIAFAWDPETFSADFTVAARSDLTTDAGLRSAVIRSLFTDRLAAADDVLPVDDGDRRGWWGDMPLDGGPTTARDLQGSRLWLLRRAVATTKTALAARGYCQEALAWLTAAPAAGGLSIASQVTVTTRWEAADRLFIGVVIARRAGREGAVNHAYDLYWTNT